MLLILGSLRLIDVIVLLFTQAFTHLANLFFKLQKLLVSHIVRVNVHSTLIMHGYHHIPQVFHIHGSVLFVSALYIGLPFFLLVPLVA